MIEFLFALFFLGLVTFYLHTYRRWSELYRRVEKTFPGPKLLPLIGNSLEFSDVKESFNKLIQYAKKYDRFYRLYLGNTPFIVLYDYRDFESVLSSNVKIEKGSIYRFLYPWIGTGLLTSSGEKWKSHRRILTPAFHFKILEPYIDFFNENGKILCQKLSEKAGKGTFNVHPIIKLYALDNIFETAMKVKMNALINSDSSYVKAIKELAEVFVKRSLTWWMYSDTLFSLTKYATVQKNALTVVHDMTKNIIRKRREELSKDKIDINSCLETDMYFNQKRRMAFLDVMLSSAEGSALSDEDICEEVSTFMFEGHDTVSSGIGFAMYALAANPAIQETAYKEQVEIFGDSDRQATYADLQEMKYLDMVLKEAQRVYPSVPIIGRHLQDDVKLADGCVLPEGCQLQLFIFQLHRDPKVWPSPNTFNPDNFLPEAAAKRSPFSYVPFSAGSRNCIGQRFAVLEMKCCLSKVLREFKLIESSNPLDKVDIFSEMVLISKNGINIQMEKRKRV